MIFYDIYSFCLAQQTTYKREKKQSIILLTGWLQYLQNDSIIVKVVQLVWLLSRREGQDSISSPSKTVGSKRMTSSYVWPEQEQKQTFKVVTASYIKTNLDYPK